MKLYTYKIETHPPSPGLSLYQLVKALDMNAQELDLVTDLLPTDSVIFVDNCVITRVDTPVDHAE